MRERSRTLFADSLEASEQHFKEGFARDLLLSERLRVTILMGGFLFSAVYAARRRVGIAEMGKGTASSGRLHRQCEVKRRASVRVVLRPDGLR